MFRQTFQPKRKFKNFRVEMDDDYEEVYFVLDFNEEPGATKTVESVLKDSYQVKFSESNMIYLQTDESLYKGTIRETIGTDFFTRLVENETLEPIGCSLYRADMHQVTKIPNDP